MLIGYVSDEYHLAVAGARLELRRASEHLVVQAAPSGALRADIAPGSYECVLAAEGYGAKRLAIDVHEGMAPLRLRLLSSRPYGYAWPRCAPSGSTVELRVHAPEAHTVELWRYGWEPERVAVIGDYEVHPTDSNRQILPDGDVSALGCRWNDNGFAAPPHPRWTVPAPEDSGLYFFRLRTASGAGTTFPLVVSPPTPRAQIAVLASDITWCAYNDFGGRSNYIVPRGLPTEPTVNSRQEGLWFPDPELCAWDGDDYPPLSFDRPDPRNVVAPDERITDPVAVRGGEHLAAAEWRLLGWLEREGFPHDLYGETQLHAGEVPLEAYRVLVLSTHPEYWSRDMYQRVKRWVLEDAGRLAYLGGNGINCEVVMDGDTMVVRNGRQTDLIKAATDEPVATRFEQTVESEAMLLGVRHTWAGFETGYPYRVESPDHWAFAGTGLRQGDLVGERNLNTRCAPGGASGHETDKLGPASPDGTTLLATGTNPDDGGAHMVHVGFPGGGEVFSAGSIAYPASLPVDAGLSLITANVLRAFLSRDKARSAEQD